MDAAGFKVGIDHIPAQSFKINHGLKDTVSNGFYKEGLPDEPELGFFFLSNAKFGGGLLILGLWSLLVAVILHTRKKKA